MNDDSAFELARPQREFDETAPASHDDDRPTQTATVDAPERRVRRVRGKRRRRRRRLARIRHALLPVVLVIVLILTIVGLWAGSRALAAWHAYQATRTDIDRLQAQRTLDPSTASPDDLARLQTNFQDLSFDLKRLDSVLTMTGAQPILGHLPWTAPRYRAAQQLLTIGELLANAGASGAGIAQETLTDFQQTGVMSNGKATSPTWLDVVTQHQADIEQIAQQVNQAQQLRASLDTAMLPGSARSRLGELDRWLNKYDVQQLVNQDLPAIEAALGATFDKRYMLVFQDNQNLRPAGGFAGTLAYISLCHGRITDYSFSTSTPLSNAYNGNRTEIIPQPWPLHQFLAQDGFQIQDALWWGDFPRGAKVFMQMYAETGWPPIDGVMGIQPAAVSNILHVTGPVTIDVDGQPRTVTADNLLQEIDRQEILRRQGVDVATTHKEVLETVGEKLIQELAGSDRGQLVAVVRQLSAAAGRRDIQMYVADEKLQATLDARGWTGKLRPDPAVPTLAVTMGNVAENKSALTMHPSMDLRFGSTENGKQNVTLQIDLANNGDTDGPIGFNGFQRWYVEVQLPTGSTLDSSQPDALPNPEAPNGGSYLIEIFPQQVGHLTVSFRMPQTDKLLVRRQPGLNEVRLTSSSPTCGTANEVNVGKDMSIVLRNGCPSIVDR